MQPQIPYTPLSRWRWLALVAVLLLSAYVIIDDMLATSLWADEGWTIATTNEESPVAIITDWVAVDVHPPLFFLELWGWRQFTGDTIFEMRVFSTLVALVAVAVMYRLGRAMFASVWAGVLAALLFGVHDLVSVLTNEVRHYPQQQLMTALTLWLYWRFWQKPTRRRGIAFVLGGTALLWSHYWGGFILLSIALHILFTRRHNLRPYMLAMVTIGLLFVPWFPALYNQITYERPSGLPHALENNWEVYKTLVFQLAGAPEILWLGLAIVGLVGTSIHHRPIKQWRIHPAALLLVTCVLITPLMSIGFNHYYPTLSFRSLAVTVPPLMALIAHGIMSFRLPERSILVAFVVVHSLLTTSAEPIPRAPWVPYSEFLAQHTTHDDIILLELDSDEFNVEYYLTQLTDQAPYAHSESERENNPNRYTRYLNETLREHDGVWVAKLDYPYYDIRNDLSARGYVPTAETILWEVYVDGRPIELWRYDKIDVEADPVLTLGERFALTRISTTSHPDWVTINLIWSPLVNLDDFYTVSVFLLNEGGAIPAPSAQHDSYPFEGRSPTLGWETGRYYFDSHVLYTNELPRGRYRVGIKIYRAVNGDYGNLEILTPSDCADAACTYAIVDEVVLE